MRAGDERLPSSILTDFAQAWTTDKHDSPTNGSFREQIFTNAASDQLLILAPQLCLTKSCLNATGEMGSVIFSGSVSNCGNTLLTNVVVSNLVNGAFVYVLGPTNLNINQSIAFVGSYSPANPCAPTPDTLFAWGTDALSLTVSNSATATCSNVNTASIVVTKTCPPGPVAPGDLVAFTGSVSNSGNVTLTNVVILNDHPSNSTPVAAFASIPPHAVQLFGGSYVAPFNVCSLPDTLTARATSICGTMVSNSSMRICVITNTPGIIVTKFCPPNPVLPGSPLTFSGIVSNSGNIALSNIIIVNTRLTNNTPVTNMASLAIGQAVRFTNTYIVPNTFTNCAIDDTLTARATDLCGTQVTNANTASCPVIRNLIIVCPPAMTFQCSNSIPPCPGTLALFIAAGGMVGDSNVIYSCTDGPFIGGLCGGTLTRTHRIVDACTNFASCTQTFTVRDTTPPVITCQPSRTNEWVAGSAPAFGAAVATDNCDTNLTLTFVDTQLAAICPAVRIFRRTWTATDVCTNSATCSQTITFVDTVPPVITCQPNRTNEWVTGSIPAFDNATAIDACDTNVVLTFVDTPLTAICPAVRIFRRTWTATDDCTNTATCSQTITFIDTTAPVITCQPNRTNQWVTGAVPVFDIATATDTCDTNVVLTFVDTPLTAICPAVRIVRRTWTATDDCTNTATCSQTITFIDTVPPVITCQPNRTNEWVTGSVPVFDNATATDTCDTNVALTFVDTPLTAICPAVRIFRRTWTATDDCTNTATCSQTITFIDTTPPVITCQPNRTNQWVTGATPVFDNATATDTCDTNVTLTFVDTPLTAICPAVRIFRRTWTATDDCTNTATCSQTITFIDTVPPVITCQPNRTNEWVTGSVPVFDNATATDTCDTNVALTFVDTPLTAICPAVRIFRRTWTATDDCTNTATCSQTITFIDTTAPVITCQPNRTNQWVTGAVPVFDIATATDTCDTNVVLTFVDTPLTAICPAVRIVRRTWTATDDCTNTATCSQTITFIDTVPPVITCQSNRTNEWVTGSVPVFDNATATDTCDTNVALTFVDTPLTAICPAVLIFRRTWTATDDCTNTATCSQTITFIDTTAPVITCQPNRTNQWVTGATPVFDNATATDTCDTNVALTFVDTPLTAICPAVRIFRRTWTATDDCTNTATCSQTITFIDTVPPVITCQPNRTNEWVTGSVPVFDNATATDTCDTNVALTFVDTPLTAICPAVRIFRRTWTATDDCTNTATCSQTITFVDTLPPVITCQPNRTNEWVTGSVPVFDNATATDTCDTNVALTFIDTPLTAQCPAVRVFRRTWTATDDCTNTATCSQTITFIDTTAPVITCQPSRTNQWVTGSAPVFDNATATDTCDTNVALTFVDTTLPAICPAVRIFRRTWTATDDCTNTATCSQTITFIDTTPPVLTCQPNRTNEWVTGSTPAFDNATATDTCDTNVTLTFVDSGLPAACPAVRVFRRTWTATDDCTNTASCSQTITFVDTTVPVITCQPNRTNQWVTGSTPVFDTATATDTCDTNVTVTFVDTQLPPTCPAVRVFRRTWTAADDCTNTATCSQTITFIDTTAPVITCQPNRTNQWLTGSTPVFDTATATDTCDTNVTLTFVDTQLPATCPAVRIFRRTWTAADDCTNTATCSQTITFIDTTPPVITCQPNRTNEWVTGLVPVFDNATATDTCDTNLSLTFVDSALPANCPAVRIFRRTWTATDDCTNTATCSQTITFIDTTPPVITCQPNRTNQWVTGATPVFDNATATDTCDTNVTLTFVDTPLTAICPAVRIFRRTWTAADDCTNTATCSQTITFIDTVPPVITCQPNRTNEWVTGSVPVFDNATATDTCDTNVALTFVDTPLTAICPAVRIFRRTWTATDDCTNTATCSQTITFIDTTAPVITCQPNRTNQWVTGATPVFDNATATDTCDTNVTLTFVDTPLTAICPAVRIFRRTWTATDDCTNTATCSQTITFIDTVPPVITCQPNRTNEWVTGSVPVFDNATATDTCDTNVALTFVDTPLTAICPAVRIFRRTWTATDDCTNTATCSQTITFIDTTAPVITCQPNRTNQWVTGATPVFDNATATDTCDTNVTLTFVDTPLTAICPAVRIFRRTWTATDDCTNTATCSQTITFIDTVPPVITCQPNRTNEWVTGSVPVFDNATATDTCDTNVALTFVDTPLTAICPAVRIFRRTWTATDDCTNTATCSQTITFVDTLPPVITCQPNRTNEWVTGSVPVFDNATATDTCDTNVALTFIDTPLTAQCPAVRVFRRTWTATDDCTNTATCSQTITFIDTTAPVITCQPNRTNQWVTGATPVFDNATATDTCDTNVALTFVDTPLTAICPAVRIFRRTWTATDDCTNTATCSQTITFIDTVPPVITCQPNRTNQWVTGATPVFDNATATDTCDTNVALTFVDTPLTAICPAVRIFRRTWTATDDCTNTATCSQTITFIDTVPPVITCQPNRTNEWVTGSMPLFDNATATDTCDTNVALTFIDTPLTAVCPAVVIFRRTWTATDDCTNTATCSQIITFVDTTAPVITCQPNRTNQWVTGATPVFDNATATDTCDTNVTLTFVDTPLTAICPAVRIFRRTWTATDDCTNTATCSQTITFIDTVPPVITCQPNRTNQWVTGSMPLFDNATATDTCDTNVALTFIDTPLTAICPAVVVVRRTWTATDDCTNTATCSQIITFVDTTAPVITCQPNRTNQWVTGATPVFDNATATDTCDTNVALTFVDTPLTAICPAVRIFRRTWTATDDCTNTATCSQTITFIDTVPPVITCQPNRTNQWVTGSMPLFDNATATDTCDTNVALTFIDTPLTAICPAVVVVRRTWTATDDCTNTATCSQIITFVDTTAPVITCQPNRTNQWVTGATPVFDNATATDTCDTNVALTFVDTPLTAICPAVRIFRRTWTATDDCTNTATCSQTITFIDTIPPVITCQPNRTNQWVTGSMPLFDNATATDTCDTNVALTFIDTPLTAICPAVVVVRRTWTATDDCTNTATCSQIITFVDTTAPVITCQPNRTNQWVNGAVPVFDNATATDTCDTNVTLTFADAVLTAACPAVRIFRRTWTATDDCTNTATCSQTITFIDTTPPAITCPPNFAVQCLSNVPPCPGNLAQFLALGGTASDNCDTNLDYSCSDGPLIGGPCGGTITRTVRVTDDCNNSSVCLQTITVSETIPPLAIGPTNQVVCAGDSVNFRVTASGACSISYQWFKNGAVLANQTNGVLTLTNVTGSDAGQYCVKVSGLCKSVTNCAILTVQGTIGDFVWEDLNFNGHQDLPQEPGLSNVVVQLLDCVGTNILRTTTTDTTGHYLFACVDPGNYQVRFVRPTGYFFTMPDVGPDDADSDPNPANGLTACFTLTNGQNNRTIDAGLLRPSCIGDFVWEDLNANGLQDAGEPGIPNVSLNLIDCASGTVVANTVTGPTGKYLFCDLFPGSYRVEILVPGGYFITVPNSGLNDCVDSDAIPGTRLTDCNVLISGTTNLCVDIGLKRPATIGDFVWNDFNHNGIQDSGEPGFSNVVVRLLDCSDNVLRTTNTSSLGRYYFTDLQPGSYKVQFVAPAGCIFTLRDQGVNDAVDSDASLADGRTICVTLVSGEINLTVDAGLFCPPPCVKVTKLVACLLPGDQCGPFGKVATGIKGGTNLPGFCYSITVSNCSDGALTNLTVMDTPLGDLTSSFFTSPLSVLAPHASLTRNFKKAWDVDTTNRVTVIATGALTLGPNGLAISVTNSDEAVALIDEAKIACNVTLFSPDDRSDNTNDAALVLPDNGTAHVVVLSVMVMNIGESDLANVTVFSPSLSALGCTNLPAPFPLPMGMAAKVTLCQTLVACPSPLTNLLLTVTAQASTNSGCVFGTNGVPVSVRTECPATIACESLGNCRVTGGGRQDDTWPPVRYMTHGGQVGAPVGTATTFDPDSACIHGNWEVVRHDKGSSSGNFHAKSFDSLLCACLACPQDPNSGFVIGGLCNPGARTCGPEPRRAPANKICFSGVGDFTESSGQRIPRSVLFRVDIEDRSEPGNSHAGGGTPPPDRHRIRIWILTTAELAQLNNPNDRLLGFRRAVACTPGSTALEDGAIGANGLAVPLGTQVFGVRRPDIDDGGEMTHGNHQIHPSIKDCP